MPTIDATVGGANANSYDTLAEVQAYLDARFPIAAWDLADSQDALVIMATRVLNAQFQPTRILVQAQNGRPAYYLTRRTWTGAPATTTQRLPWPRIGMYDKNGNAISSGVIPSDLKDAVAELTGQLSSGDRTLDLDFQVQGLTSVRAGSVSLTFNKDAGIIPVLPDAVISLMPTSWFTDEVIEPAIASAFDVFGAP